MTTSWRLSHARGYLELGMIAEAAAELEAIPAEQRSDPDVLLLRMALYQHREEWPALQRVSAELARKRPQETAAWVMWAYATRRAETLESAEKILKEARQLHPADATIAFNLGCYACLRGDIPEANRLVSHAIVLDRKFREIAATDPDLEALRATRSWKK